MSYLLDVKEILGFAVYIEQRGYEFYVGAMKKFSDPQATPLFQYLADEEFKHETLFKKMLDNEAGFRPMEPDAEYQSYMREFLKAHQLGDREAIEDKLARLATLDEILELAMGFEKDSIVLFSELKELASRGQAAALEQVVREEMKHLRKIFAMKRALARP
jgi:rubrerythrin